MSFDDIVADIRAFLLLVLGSSFLLLGFEMGFAHRCDAGWTSCLGPPKFTRCTEGLRARGLVFVIDELSFEPGVLEGDWLKAIGAIFGRGCDCCGRDGGLDWLCSRLVDDHLVDACARSLDDVARGLHHRIVEVCAEAVGRLWL